MNEDTIRKTIEESIATKQRLLASCLPHMVELCQLAVRTCGGQSMLKSLPLERLYRDSRCGSLMLPWSADLCLERIGRDALYLPGESD